jgi:hypothetical protein
MSFDFDWTFVDKDDAKAEIRAAIEYLLRGAAGSTRGDIVREINEIDGEHSDPLDDGLPGG